MKKMITGLLALLLCFSAAILPLSAMEIPDMSFPTDFPQIDLPSDFTMDIPEMKQPSDFPSLSIPSDWTSDFPSDFPQVDLPVDSEEIDPEQGITDTVLPVKQYVFDDLDLLTEAEEMQLNAQFQALSERLNADIVAVLTDYCIGDVADDAYDFYKNGSFRPDGAIYYCAITDAYWNMQAFGEVDDAYTEAAYDRLENACLDLLRKKDYYESLKTFGEVSEDLIEQYREGMPFKGEFPWIKYLAIALILGFIVALIVVLVFKAQLKSVRSQSYAHNYLKRDSLKITEERDIYLYRTVTKVPKPKDNSSGGGGGGGGSRGGGRSGRI